MTAQPQPQTVVCDACVLINLLIAGQDGLLRNLKGYRFVATTVVIHEVQDEKQARDLKGWLERGVVTEVPLMQDKERGLLTVLSKDLDDGEANSLALAAGRGYLWATDESGIAQHLSCQYLGPNRILSTIWLLKEGIRQGLLDVEGADAVLKKLKKNRFRANIESFAELP